MAKHEQALVMSGVLSCQPNCGKCCDEPGGIVYLRPQDAEMLANHHGMEVVDWLKREQTNHGWQIYSEI